MKVNIDAIMRHIAENGGSVGPKVKLPECPTKRGPHTDGLHSVSDCRQSAAVAGMDTSLTITLPIRTVSITNMGGKLHDKLKLKAEQKLMLAVELPRHESRKAEFANGCTILFKRVSNRRLDSDNLPGAFKTVRDCVAQWLLGGAIGEMDDSPLLTWVYEQGKIGSAKGVIITISKTPIITSSAESAATSAPSRPKIIPTPTPRA